jgi:hypothetical protein
MDYNGSQPDVKFGRCICICLSITAPHEGQRLTHERVPTAVKCKSVSEPSVTLLLRLESRVKRQILRYLC